MLNGPLIAILFAAVIVVGFITAFIATALRKRIRRPATSAALAGLVIPLLLCCLGFFGMLDAGTEVDGPPPGNVLAGTLGLAVVLTPFTLIVSALVTRWASKKAATS